MEHFPITCEQCDKQGFIIVDNIDKPFFVICNSCGKATSQVWCPRCGMGGAFVRNIHKRPTYWICESCKTKYQLPSDFYNNPVNLILEQDLPAEAFDQVREKEQVPREKVLPIVAFTLLFGTAVVGVVAIFWLIFYWIWSRISLLQNIFGLIGFLALCITWLATVVLYFARKSFPFLMKRLFGN